MVQYFRGFSGLFIQTGVKMLNPTRLGCTGNAGKHEIPFIFSENEHDIYKNVLG